MRLEVTFNGLPNTRAVRRGAFANTPTAIIQCLRKRVVATAASDFGSLSVWDDKDGLYRCEAYRYRNTVDSRTFTSLKGVRGWAPKWLLWIHHGETSGKDVQ